jgi:hypothetical protein
MKRQMVIGALAAVLLSECLVMAADLREVKLSDVPPEMTNALARFGAGKDTKYFRVDSPSSNSSWKVEIRDNGDYKKLFVSTTEKVVNGKTNTVLVRIDHGSGK